MPVLKQLCVLLLHMTSKCIVKEKFLLDRIHLVVFWCGFVIEEKVEW